MSADRADKYLWDAHTAAERIARFTAERTFDDYLADDMLRAAVERQFEIIGEAFVGLRRADPLLAERIPDLSRIVAFRMQGCRPHAKFGGWLNRHHAMPQRRKSGCVAARPRTDIQDPAWAGWDQVSTCLWTSAKTMLSYCGMSASACSAYPSVPLTRSRVIDHRSSKWPRMVIARL